MRTSGQGTKRWHPAQRGGLQQESARTALRTVRRFRDKVRPWRHKIGSLVPVKHGNRWSTASKARIHFNKRSLLSDEHYLQLHRKLNPGGGLMTAKQFFTVLEIEAAVALLDMAVVPKLMRWLTRISAIKSG